MTSRLRSPTGGTPGFRQWGRLARMLGVVAALAVPVCGRVVRGAGEGPVPPPPRVTPSPQGAGGTAVLRVEGRCFVDPEGRVVFLRGVNLAGDSKVPPFLPLDDIAALDPLPALGINTVRLLFLWEGYEPEPGMYNEAYLARLVEIAHHAWARGLYVIVDIHQDGLSRWASRGCGAGFPAWVISPRARRAQPDNGDNCKAWVFRLITDPNLHRSLTDFYADAHGARTRFLAMAGRVAAAFANCPGVIGYDLLNEPWGREQSELGPLYRDEARAIRERHPEAILFVAGHGTTSCGLQTRLPRPGFSNFAYAPHYYFASAIARNAWGGSTRPIVRSFAGMESKAAEWGVPLFVGEFGIGAEARRGSEYVALIYDHLDANLASGAQWNYTPRWDARDRDGWNGEDFSILDHRAQPRPNFQARPAPRKVAGVPLRILYRPLTPATREPARFEFTWDHRPGSGATEIYVPSTLFPPGSTLTLEPADTPWERLEARQLIVVRTPRPGVVRVALTAP